MPNCFVIMPFGGEFDRYYADVLKPTLGTLNLLALRGDEIYGTNAIITDIYTAIADADICIADVTGRNPNVSYELGMAHSLAKPVVILTQNITDVPFDYSHWRITSYDPHTAGWEAMLAQALRNTITEVLKRPGEFTPFNAAGTREGKMKSHLLDIFFASECILDKSEVVHVDERGGARVKTTWTVDARSDMFHMCDNRGVEMPGRMEVLRAHDRMNARDMEIIELRRTPTFLTYLMLMSSPKRKGQRFVLETEMYLENYLGTLPLTGQVNMIHQAAVRAQIRYKKIVEEYRLPKLERYRGAHAEYISHPDPEKIGKTVDAREEDDAYVVQVEYETDEPFRHDVGIIIRDGMSLRH